MEGPTAPKHMFKNEYTHPLSPHGLHWMRIMQAKLYVDITYVTCMHVQRVDDSGQAAPCQVQQARSSAYMTSICSSKVGNAKLGRATRQQHCTCREQMPSSLH